MCVPLSGAARSASCLVVTAGLLLAASCAKYERQPLVTAEFERVLNERLKESNVGERSVDGLTLEEAEQVCLYVNPRLRKARAAANVKQVSAQYAGLWDDPVLNLDGVRALENLGTLDFVDDSLNPYTFGGSIGFTIPISGRLSVEKDAANAEAYAAIVGVWLQEQQVLLELRHAWATWMEAQESLEASRELLEQLNDLVAITNEQEALGEMIAAEAVAFRLAESRLALEVEELAALENQSRLTVLSVLGLPPYSKVRLLASPYGEAPSFSTDHLYTHCPEVVLAAAEYEAAEERLRLEIRKQYPDIDLGPAYEFEEGVEKVGLGISIPLPILNANKQGIAEARARREAARADWERAIQQNMADYVSVEAELKAAIRRRETLESTIVPLAGEQITEAQRMAELGEINTLLILEALQSEREAALDLIRAHGDIVRATAALRGILPEQAPLFHEVSAKENE